MGKKQRKRGRPHEEQITDVQRNALKEVRDYIAARKYPPTMSELGDLLGVTAASAHQLIKQLENKGYVSREPRKARSLKVVRDLQEQLEKLIPVPLIGVVQAGPAMLAEENCLGEVLVDHRIVGSGRCFALRVSGDSMVNAGIRDGDVVICRQQPVAESGEIVVALLDDESTVKRLVIRSDHIELQPENKRFKPIPVKPDIDFRIIGKVLAIRSDVGK
jgi:repressor LexA